jgi:hypothetical protein
MMIRPRIVLLLMSVLLVLSACGGGEPEHRVLFVGNSYTHFNDLPDMVEQIAEANDVLIDWEMIAPGGFYLDQHLGNPDVVNALNSGDFDTVIFQEQSVITSVPELASSQTIPAAVSLDALADSAGVRVLWFQTWGRLNGFPEVGHQNFSSMQAQITQTYDTIGQRTNASVVRVGDAWQRVNSRGLGVGLYAADGSHPSPAGSYVAAVEIAEAVTGRQVVDAPSVSNVDSELAEMLLAASG